MAIEVVRRIRAGRCAPRPARRPLPDVVHLLHGLPGGEAVSRDWNPEQAEAISRRRARVRVGGRRHRQDRGAGRARAAADRRGHVARRDPRDHVHRPRGVRAEGARPRPRSSCAATSTAPARSTRPGSRPSTASAPGYCAPTRSPPGSTPSSPSRDEVGARILQSEAFDIALERFLAEDGPVGVAAARPARRVLAAAAARAAARGLRAAAQRRPAARPAAARRAGHRRRRRRGAGRRRRVLHQGRVGGASWRSSTPARPRPSCAT